MYRFFFFFYRQDSFYSFRARRELTQVFPRLGSSNRFRTGYRRKSRYYDSFEASFDYSRVLCNSCEQKNNRSISRQRLENRHSRCCHFVLKKLSWLDSV